MSEETAYIGASDKVIERLIENARDDVFDRMVRYAGGEEERSYENRSAYLLYAAVYDTLPGLANAHELKLMPGGFCQFPEYEVENEYFLPFDVDKVVKRIANYVAKKLENDENCIPGLSEEERNKLLHVAGRMPEEELAPVAENAEMPPTMVWGLAQQCADDVINELKKLVEEDKSEAVPEDKTSRFYTALHNVLGVKELGTEVSVWDDMAEKKSYPRYGIYNVVVSPNDMESLGYATAYAIRKQMIKEKGARLEQLDNKEKQSLFEMAKLYEAEMKGHDEVDLNTEPPEVLGQGKRERSFAEVNQARNM